MVSMCKSWNTVVRLRPSGRHVGICANGNKSAEFRWIQAGVAEKCSRRCVISPDDYEKLIDPKSMKDKDRSLLDRVLAPFHCYLLD